MKDHKRMAEKLKNAIEITADDKSYEQIVSYNLHRFVVKYEDEIQHMLQDVIDAGIVEEAPKEVQDDVNNLDKLFDDPLKQLKEIGDSYKKGYRDGHNDGVKAVEDDIADNPGKFM